MNRLKTVLAVTLIGLVVGRVALAAPPAYVAVDVPLQRVDFFEGGTGAFGVKAFIRFNGRARGVLKIRLADQTALSYDVLGGGWTQDLNSREISVALYLLRRRIGPPRPDDFAVAQSMPDAGVRGCDVWDFMGNGVSSRFRAMGEITLGLPQPPDGRR